MKKIANGIFWIGCNDHDIDIFEGQYHMHGIGMAYNSYVIVDKKIAVMDTVDQSVGEDWLKQLDEVLGGRKPDYLVIQHMEPDHSGSIVSFMDKYPGTTILSSKQAFAMMSNFYGHDYADRREIIAEGSTLDLGVHQLHFVGAPMVHWPEVLMTYESTDKVLFSADGFGKFGASDYEDDWVTEARRYYTGIVGQYGVQVMTVLKKAATLDIKVIAPLHGYPLTEDLGKYIGLYTKWASYEPEDENGIVIYYASVYGHTEAAAKYLAEECRNLGFEHVVVHDLKLCDMTEAVSDSFRYKNLVFASMTCNADVSPHMSVLLNALMAHKQQNKKVALIENGSWYPFANVKMRKLLQDAPNMNFVGNVSILSSMTEENKKELKDLAAKLKA